MSGLQPRRGAFEYPVAPRSLVWVAAEGRLDTQRFVRIHRSRIVNTDRIKEMQPWFNGEYVVVLQNGTRLTLSRGYCEKLQER